MQKIENGLRPVHPGEVLREEFLVPLDMTANALAGMLHVTPARINGHGIAAGSILWRHCGILDEPAANL
jgi:hypothetical protein